MSLSADRGRNHRRFYHHAPEFVDVLRLEKSGPLLEEKLAHVGRLDKESEGLLLLANNCDLAFQITHPQYRPEKEYLVMLAEC